MVIVYVSSAMDEQDFVEFFQNSPHKPGQQTQKYNRLMMQGLAKNDAAVYAVTGRPITEKNCTQRFIPALESRKGNLIYYYSSTINIRGIKNLWQMISTYHAVLHRCNVEDSAVIVDVLNASIAYGASLAAKRLRCPCIGIVTDLPELMVTGTGTTNSYAKLVHKVMRNCTGYVILTEAMNQPVNPKGKPYIVVEGLCDSEMQESERSRNSGIKRCIYAGLLNERYGVKEMVEGFLLADLPKTELHIYGDGPYAAILRQIAKEHPTVVYHGVVMNKEVVQTELESDLLINPRPTYEQFTKYSFPSKNMEYMVSGVPVLTTDLPGMPEEYRKYVFLIEDESAHGIAEAFRRVLTLPDEELWEKGRTAREFVLAEKNNVVQARKVLHLITGSLL